VRVADASSRVSRASVTIQEPRLFRWGHSHLSRSFVSRGLHGPASGCVHAFAKKRYAIITARAWRHRHYITRYKSIPT
jgi:hypothetical protein